jgi:uncharacterized protein (DUF1778 family)
MSNPKLSMRLTEADSRLLRLVAAHVQATQRTPFVSPGDAVRAALALAVHHIVADRTASTASATPRTAG